MVVCCFKNCFFQFTLKLLESVFYILALKNISYKITSLEVGTFVDEIYIL